MIPNNTASIVQFTNSLNKASIVVKEFNQTYFESILTSLGVRFTNIDGLYRIRYYTTDKNYTIIEAKQLNTKLLNTIWKYYKD